MVDHIHNVIVSPRLEPLRPVLSAWGDVVSDYCNFYANDACYWYNERASISVFAGAAWRCDWFAMEEYSTEKRTPALRVQKEKRQHYRGRCDLYIARRAGATDEPTSFAIEAKQITHVVNPSVAETEWQPVEETLSDAWADAGRIDASDASKRLSMVFCVPRFSTDPDGNSTLDCAGGAETTFLEAWLEMLLKRTTHDAIAWVFPAYCRTLEAKRGGFYPGCAVLIRERQRGVRQRQAVSSKNAKFTVKL